MVCVADPLERPRQEQNQRGRDHPLQAGDPGTQSLLQRQRSRPNPQGDGGRRRDKHREQQHALRVRVFQHVQPGRSFGRLVCAVATSVAQRRQCVTARPPHADRHESDHQEQRDPGIAGQLASLLRLRLDGRKDLRIDEIGPTQMSLRRGPPFGPQHRSEIVADKNRQGREHQHQDRIKTIRQARQERRRRPAGRAERKERLADRAAFGSEPRRNYGDRRHRSARRIDEKGKFLPRDLEPVRKRPQHLSHDQRMRIIVEEGGEPEEQGQQLALFAGLGPPTRADRSDPRGRRSPPGRKRASRKTASR